MYKIKKFNPRSVYLLSIIAGSLLLLGSCRDGSMQSGSSNNNSVTDVPAFAGNNPFANSTEAATINQPGGQHFMCVNNCEGSGSETAGTCPVCGEALVHNDAYHSNEQQEFSVTQNTDDNVNNSFTLPNNPSASSQNNSGAQHYVCSDGCGGGSDSHGRCPDCGATLVHNDAYHAQQNSNPSPVTSQPQNQGQNNSQQKYPSIFNTPNAPSASTPGRSSGGNGFHYVCSAGCGGGAQSQGSCPSCGSALVHNDAYHM